MGCVPSEKRIQNKLTPFEYRLIWNKCLKVNSITLHPPLKKQHPVFLQIGKDIDRTFPEHLLFNQKKNKQIFERVLRSFALEFPKTGYTQGLNFVAGYLLVNNLGEEQSLKTLIAMCTHPDLMLIGLYEDDFPLVRLQCELFWLAAKKICPDGYTILKNANLPDQMWLFQWFLTLFIYSFPLSYIQDFLNFIVVKKYFAAVRIAVAILQCLQKYISGKHMKQESFIECFQLLKTQEFCHKFLPIEGIIKRAQRISNDFIMSCLQDATTKNWYKSYFSTPAPQCHKQYNKMMAVHQQERQQFHRGSDMVNSKYTRSESSTNVIDTNEESIVKRYDCYSYHSNVSRNSIFISRMSGRHNQSVGIINSIKRK